MALTLSTGAIASGVSAAWLYGLLPEPHRHEITLARRPRLVLPALVRTSADLPPGDRTRVDGIPTTAPARTLIDIGATLRRDKFEDVLDTAIVQGVVTAARLEARATELRAPRRSGCAVVLSMVADRHPELTLARNGWEARVLRIVGRLGLPLPRCNYPVRVGGRRRVIDLAWPDAKVAVELDGFVPHSKRRVFDDDRARQNELVAATWTVFRLTRTLLDADAAAAFAPVARVLAQKLARFGT